MNIRDDINNLFKKPSMTTTFENVSICTFQNNSIFDYPLPNILHFLILEMPHLGDQQNMTTFYLYFSEETR